MLWAASMGTSYPWHGLSQVLDDHPNVLPYGIESTVAGLDLDDLHAAVLASAAVLDEVSAAAATRCPGTLPTAMAAFTKAVLSSRTARPRGRTGDGHETLGS